MARKIIKAILFILAAVVVAGGIMTYLRSQRKVTPAPVTQKAPPIPEPKSSELKQITVSGQGSNAQVQIQGINERNYNISNLPNGEGFKIQVPHAQIQQVQKLLDKPHPLIKKIEVRESAENPTTAEVIFTTEKNVNFLDTQKDGNLTIDFVKTDAVPEEKTTTADTAPTPTPKAEKSSPSKKSNAVSSTKSSSKKTAKSSKKSPKVASTKKSKKSAGAEIKLQPFDASMVDESEFGDQSDTLIPQDAAPSLDQQKADKSMDLSAFGTPTPSTETIPLGQEEVPTIEPDAKPSAEDNDGFNLKEVVKEPSAPANLLDAETQMSLSDNLGGGQKVAAVPSDQKFDISKIKANLPALQNLVVQRSGNSTMVTFDREKAVPFKVFRMVNPSRIVVDFKDTTSKLKPEYPRFSGTKISRIETREYGSPDGMLVRVIMYVDGAPNYKSSKSGNNLVLEIQ